MYCGIRYFYKPLYMCWNHPLVASNWYKELIGSTCRFRKMPAHHGRLAFAQQASLMSSHPMAFPCLGEKWSDIACPGPTQWPIANMLHRPHIVVDTLLVYQRSLDPLGVIVPSRLLGRCMWDDILREDISVAYVRLHILHLLVSNLE